MYYSIYCGTKENKVQLLDFLKENGYKLISEIVATTSVCSIIVEKVEKNPGVIYLTRVDPGMDTLQDFVSVFEKWCVGNKDYHQTYFNYTDPDSYDSFLTHLGFTATKKVEGKRKISLEL